MAEAPDLPLSHLARQIWDYAYRLSLASDPSRLVEPVHLLLAFDQAGRAALVHSALRGLPC